MKITLYQIITLLLGIGSKDKRVGTVFYSEYLNSHIIVTRYIKNDHWYFEMYDKEYHMQHGVEMRAGSTYRYFEDKERVKLNG